MHRAIWRSVGRVAQIVAASLALSISISGSAVAQSAILAGKVLTDSADRPLVNAEITIKGTDLVARSDSSGSFQLTGIKAGKHEVVIRLVGYESVSTTINFDATKKVEADFLLKRSATELAKVEVKDRKPITNIRLAQFDENRKTAGKFLTADVFEKAGGRPLATILTSKFTGMRVNRNNGREVMVSSRDAGDCFMSVFLNGINVSRIGPFDLMSINSTSVIGVEYYTAPQTPQKYTLSGAGAGASCGTIVVWTQG